MLQRPQGATIATIMKATGVAARKMRHQKVALETNRTIIAFGLLLCVVLVVGGAYLLGLLELVSALH
jgi:hypothetical protein